METAIFWIIIMTFFLIVPPSILGYYLFNIDKKKYEIEYKGIKYKCIVETFYLDKIHVFRSGRFVGTAHFLYSISETKDIRFYLIDAIEKAIEKETERKESKKKFEEMYLNKD